MEKSNTNADFDERNYKSNYFKEITDEELAIVLYKHKRWIESDGKNGEQAQLIKFNLREKNLSDVNLEKAKLSGSNFSKANLMGANLKGASLKGSILNDTNLLCADLSGAELRFAELKRAKCWRTSFRDAQLFRTNFKDAEVEETNFVDAKTGDKSLDKILTTANLKSICFDALANNFKDEQFPLSTTTEIGKVFKSKYPKGHFNFGVIAIILAVGILTTAIFANGIFEPKTTSELNNKLVLEVPNKSEIENNVNKDVDNIDNIDNVGTNVVEESNEEIPYLLELNASEAEENLTITLAVSNITTLDLEEVPKEILVGNKEVVEVTKSSRNPRRLYLTGKTAIDSSNIIIQTRSKTIMIFLQIVEDTSVGKFNRQVKVLS
ncbi:MAG: pentapeptide repeat-containing protein [Blastocatellia bacterium]